jgi:hypothetical protein
LNICRVSNVRQTEIHITEPLVPRSSPFQVEISIGNLKKYKSPGNDQIPAELIHAGREILRSEIQKLVNLIWSKGELPEQWKESTIVPIYIIFFTLVRYSIKMGVR